MRNQQELDNTEMCLVPIFWGFGKPLSLLTQPHELGGLVPRRVHHHLDSISINRRNWSLDSRPFS
jgi:hypothetical protein